MSFLRKKTVPSTPFSDFIRNAPASEKKRVYSRVLERAAEKQREVVVRVAKRRLAG